MLTAAASAAVGHLIMKMIKILKSRQFHLHLMFPPPPIGRYMIAPGSADCIWRPFLVSLVLLFSFSLGSGRCWSRASCRSCFSSFESTSFWWLGLRNDNKTTTTNLILYWIIAVLSKLQSVSEIQQQLDQDCPLPDQVDEWWYQMSSSLILASGDTRVCHMTGKKISKQIPVLSIITPFLMKAFSWKTSFTIDQTSLKGLN